MKEKRDRTYGYTASELRDRIVEENGEAKYRHSIGRDGLNQVSHEMINQYLDALEEVSDE